MVVALVAVALLQTIDSTPPRHAPRTVAIDERLAADAGLRIGERIVLSSTPGAAGDTVAVAALVRRRADPSEVARADYRVRTHLDELQSLIGYGDRVDRFAVATRDSASTGSAIAAINAPAYGFQAYSSRENAAE